MHTFLSLSALCLLSQSIFLSGRSRKSKRKVPPHQLFPTGYRAAFPTSFPILSAALIFLACSCSSNPRNEAEEQDGDPNEGDSIQTIALHRGTNTTFLANVKEIGLFSSTGRVTCMVIDKADSNHLIAGGATGGLWTSHNRGITWAPINDQLPTLNIRSICQNPLQSNVYYASCYTQILNGGPTTFRPDIYKSTDGGQTFQLLPVSAGNFSLVLKVVCSPLNQNTIYAISGQFGTGGVYRSQDGGQTFTSVLNTSTSIADLEILPNGTILASDGAQVYRSATGNAGSFTVCLNGSSGTHTFSEIDLAYCQSQPANVYGVSTGGNSGVGIFKSIDAGQTWSFLQSIPTAVAGTAIGIKPNNPDFFFAGSVGLYLSQNAGSSFVFYGVGGVDWRSVNFDPNNPDKVFVTFDQGIVEVGLNPFNPNNNTAYITRDSLLNCAQIYAGDYFTVGDRVIAGMQDLGTRQVYTNGELGVAGGDGGSCFYNKQDTTVAYGSYQGGIIFKRTNIQVLPTQPGYTQAVTITNQLDANNDGTIDEGASFINYFWLNSADGNQLYYPTKKRLWRSIDGGTNWQPVSNFYDLTQASPEAAIEGNGKSNPTVYWTVADTLYIKPNAKTAGAGNEIKVKMPLTVNSIRVDPGNDSVVYITSSAGTTGARIYRSGNLFAGNVQWTSLTGDLPDQIATSSFEINPQDRSQMILGTRSGLYVTKNGGAHWDRDVQFPNVNIAKTVIRPSDKRIFIFTLGRGAWAASFPAPNVVAQTTKETDLKVWPNPCQGIMHVTIPEGTKHPSLQVRSMDGRLQKNFSGLQQNPSNIDLSSLPAGTYLLALYEGASCIKTARVIKN